MKWQRQAGGGCCLTRDTDGTTGTAWMGAQPGDAPAKEPQGGILSPSSLHTRVFLPLLHSCSWCLRYLAPGMSVGAPTFSFPVFRLTERWCPVLPDLSWGSFPLQGRLFPLCQPSKENFPRALGTAEVQAVLCEEFCHSPGSEQGTAQQESTRHLAQPLFLQKSLVLPHPSCSPGQADPHPHVPQSCYMEQSKLRNGFWHPPGFSSFLEAAMGICSLAGL